MKKVEYYDIVKDLEQMDKVNSFVLLAVGGRERGKTYSSLKYAYFNNIKFVFVKRTLKDLEMLMESDNNEGALDLSPFKALNRDFNLNVHCYKYADGLGAFYDVNKEDPEDKRLIGMAVSLKRVKAVRGFDVSDYNLIIFDEFIDDVNARMEIRNEGDAIFNLYSSVDRGRTRRGHKPVKLLMLANSNSLENDFLRQLNLQSKLYRMQEIGQEYCKISERKILIHRIPDFEDVEEDPTPLMMLTKGTRFYEMAFKNRFAYNDVSLIEYRTLKGKKPVVRFYDDVNSGTIWAGNGELYLTHAHGGETIPEFNLGRKHEHVKLINTYLEYLDPMYIEGKFYFEDYGLKSLYLKARKPEPK